MLDFNSLIKLIDTNNDKIIQKTEVDAYLKKNKSPSIFSGYLPTIDKDISISTFEKSLKEIQQDSPKKMTTEIEKDKKYFEKTGYFDYNNEYQPEIKVAKSLEDINGVNSNDHVRDARGYDISSLNLSKEDLLNLCIDKSTILSDEQQAIIEKHTEKMKDPGLGIRALHEQGFTGKGIKMAIIDQPLGQHKEYSSNIVEHHDINAFEMGWTKASMHGASVTSIAAGKTIGVAPDATIKYYSAVNFSNDPKDIALRKATLLKEIENNKDNQEYVAYLEEQLKASDSGCIKSNQPYVNAINKILDSNEKLPDDEKVSVISISWGFDKLSPGYEELQKALARAKEQGVFIVSTALDAHYGMETCGANRNPQEDPNNPEAYEAGAFWKGHEFNNVNKDELLLFPMDHRTTADYTDDSSYRYEGNEGGMSWSTPWIAGTYVLAKQANPKITPEEFWKIALETSDECRNNDDNTYVGRLINPQKLIEKIKQ